MRKNMKVDDDSKVEGKVKKKNDMVWMNHNKINAPI
jgi:hypothetical protein